MRGLHISYTTIKKKNKTIYLIYLEKQIQELLEKSEIVKYIRKYSNLFIHIIKNYDYIYAIFILINIQ